MKVRVSSHDKRLSNPSSVFEIEDDFIIILFFNLQKRFICILAFCIGNLIKLR